MKYTLTGHFASDPTAPTVHTVEAESIAEAIKQAEVLATWDDPYTGKHKNDPYINDFVFEGEPKVVSTWAG